MKNKLQFFNKSPYFQMNEEHRNALQASLHEICQDLDAEDTLPYLMAKRILQGGQAQEIMVEKSPKTVISH